VLLFVVIPLFGVEILGHPLHILLIAVPLILQTVQIFFIAYWGAKKSGCFRILTHRRG